MIDGLDRLPPHSLEAEKAALGCILLDPKTTIPEIVAIFGPSGKDAFYDLRHQVIYDTMVAMSEALKPIDLLMLSEELKSGGHLEEVGGIPFLASLPDCTPAAANLTYYTAIIEEKATLRRMIRACVSAVARIYDNEQNCETLISIAEQEVLAVRRKSGNRTREIRTVVHEAVEEIERLHAAQGEIAGLSTGLPDLDKLSDGLHGGEMIVIAGYTSSGKTSLAMNIADHIAVDHGHPVGIFSLEMSAKRLTVRLISSRARVNMRNIRDGFLSERDMPKLTSASAKLASSKMQIEEVSSMNISQLRARARQMVQQHGTKLFVIDYLQLLTGMTKRESTRENEVASISRGVKQMAMELQVPVIALSQVNKEGHLRESAAIGQDADSIWILKYPDTDSQYADAVPVDLELRKQREGPAPSVVHLTFLKTFTRFESAAKISDYDDNEKRQTRNTYAD